MKSIWFRWLISIAHGFLMVLLVTIHLDKFDFMKKAFLEMPFNQIFVKQTRPDSSRFLFINITWDRALNEKFDPKNPKRQLGFEAVTDRQKLIQFCELLEKQKDYEFVCIDIEFVDKTRYDSLLTAKINDLSKILISYGLNEKGKPELPILKTKSIAWNAFEPFDTYLLFKNDSIKTLPLLMYEQIHHLKASKGNFFYEINEMPILNYFNLNYRIQKADYDSSKYTKANLGELLAQFRDSSGKFNPEINPKLRQKLLSKRIIVIGDFNYSRYYSNLLNGETYYPLQFTNVFLALEAGDNQLNLSSFLFIWLLFTFISYHMFYLSKEYLKLILSTNILYLYTLYLFFCWLVSQFFFNLVFDFLPLIFYSLNLAVFSVRYNRIYIGIYIFLNIVASFTLSGIPLMVVNFLPILVYSPQMDSKLKRATTALNQSNQMLQETNTQLEETQAELNITLELVNEQKAKADNLLLNILPAEVAEELKEKGITEVRHYANTSVLFADVKGFSSLASQISPQELIKELDATFTKIDEIIAQHNLERIKTIGDCYMCAGGVPHRNTTNALDITLAALSIQDWMYEERQRRNGNFWQVRLGIHSGELVAGVIGKTKFAYDVWGNTVNTASRMESGGEVGKVNISETTYLIIKDFFDFTPRGAIEAKNIGMIETYFVDRIKPELSENQAGKVPNELFLQLKKERFEI